jgi:hypothetical protein
MVRLDHPSTEPAPKLDADALLVAVERETELLEELADLCQRARGTGSTPLDTLDANLQAQARVCEELEGFRARRAALLGKGGHRVQDLLLVVLGALPREQHDAAIAQFSRFVGAAERAERQITINREYFSVLLSTVEDTIAGVVSGGGRSMTYDARGLRGLSAQAVVLDRRLL